MAPTKMQQAILRFPVSIKTQDQEKIKRIEGFFTQQAPGLLEKDAFIKELSYIIIRVLFEKPRPRNDNGHSGLDPLQEKRPGPFEKIQMFDRFLKAQFDASLTDEEIILLVLAAAD